jgi:fibronectin type 3 domain-containing protein
VSYTDTAVTNGTTYYYVVQAVNSAGVSGNSVEVSATPNVIPPSPTNLAASGGNAQVALSWNSSPGAAGYNLLRSTASGGPYSTIATGTTATSYTDTGLTNGTTYFYVVQAVNSAGASGNSKEVSATPNVIPIAPASLTATAGNAQVTLSWAASTGAGSYNVLRSATSGGPYSTIATGIPGTTYTDAGLTDGTTYYYVVQAVNSAGVSASSNETSATPNVVPFAPTNVIAASGNAQVILSWSASAGAVSYNVLRSTVSGGPYASIASGIAATSYIDTGLTNGTAYFYVVQSADSAGASINSTQVTAVPNGLLQARAMANLSAFYVYKDQDSGFDHGFPSGFFASSMANLGTIHLDAGCIDNPADSTTGCYPATATDVLDTVHGTVLRISFDPQTPGNFAGLNIEDPENWGVLSTNTAPPQCGNPYSCNGYDLSGATSVTFKIRSTDGAQVQYGVGKCLTGFSQPIPSSWTTVTLTLGPPDLSCVPDLSHLNILFSVQTNDAYAPNGASVLVDDIQFTPVPARANQGGETLSLPIGTLTLGAVPQTTAPFPPDQVDRNLAPVYEATLTMQVLLNQGDAADVQISGQIADGLDYALYHDNESWYVSTAPNAPSGCYSGLPATQCGLHNAYDGGDIGLLNDQNGSRGSAKAGDVRLAGFSCGATSPTGFCLVLDGATGGNNSWAILAMLAEYKQSGNAKYLNDAITIGNWIIANLADTTGTGYSGYYVGYPDQGVPPPKPLNMGKSTENNADIFAAFMALSTVDAGHSSAWIAAANVAGDFVMQTFDSTKGHFNVGTVPAGTPASPGVCPGAQKGSDQLNTCDFLDSDTFAALAMAGSPRYSNFVLPDGTVMDWTRPIRYVLNHFEQTITVGSQTFQGFDLVPVPVSGANGIAWEFTAQADETMRYVDQITNRNTFESQADFYEAQLQLAQQLAPFGDNDGLVASTLQNGDTLPPLQQCLNTPFQNCPAERVGVAATAWMLLAEQRINPLIGAGVTPADNPAPRIVGISPSSVTVGAAPQTLVITGTNFVSGATVTYNGVLHDATFVSSTELTVPLSAGDQVTAGVYAVVVTNPSPGGGASNPVSFIVNNLSPTVSALSPPYVLAGTAAQTLTVNGSNFVPGSTVTLNGVSYPQTFVSSTSLGVSLGAADLSTAGTLPVLVTNPPPGGGTSNSVIFTINNPVPAISGVVPSSIGVGSPTQTLTIDGANFVSGSTVTFNGVPHAATFVNSSQLTINLTVSDQAVPGSYPVLVSNLPPGGGSSNSVNISVVPTRIDFAALPDSITTNLGAFFVSGTTALSNTVTVNGTILALDDVGNFVTPVSLVNGPNQIELDIQSQGGTQTFVKTITFDPGFSTANRTLLYVSSIASAFSGTIVIDPGNRSFLGFIANKHVRGISPDGGQIYMDDLSVISTATHQVLSSPSSPLTFSQSIPSDGFLVSPDGTKLYSRDEVLNLASNQVSANKLTLNIETGWAYAGPNQGGPAISPDGRYIFCGNGFTDHVQRIDTSDNSALDTGITAGPWLSDLTLTPDGKVLLVSAYWNQDQIYDATSFNLLLGPLSFGDFSGQAVVSSDGAFAVFGNAGNPQLQGGELVVVDLHSSTPLTAVSLDLADHVVISSQTVVFASSGDTPGVDALSLGSTGVLQSQTHFVLGINQFVLAYGAPQRDEIEKIVLKE